MARSKDSESVAKIIELIAKALVDEPDEVTVSSIDGAHASVFELHVASDDIGKVIGKKGRTAKSIRTLLGAVGAKLDRRFSLEILEP